MAFEQENPQHDLHVADWAWHQATMKRSFFSPRLDNPLFTVEPYRFNRDDFNTRQNWDLP